jgi:hypothetical protein
MKNTDNILLGRNKKLVLYLSRDLNNVELHVYGDYALWIGDKPELDSAGYYTHGEDGECTFIGSWKSIDFPYVNMKRYVEYGKCIEVRLSSLSRVKNKKH